MPSYHAAHDQPSYGYHQPTACAYAYTTPPPLTARLLALADAVETRLWHARRVRDAWRHHLACRVYLAITRLSIGVALRKKRVEFGLLQLAGALDFLLHLIYFPNGPDHL